ncbi:MAG: hypothetical protein AVDCRST_MAG30-1942, partial [uncultured Solirubrobacteraceae bacterium]
GPRPPAGRGARRRARRVHAAPRHRPRARPRPARRPPDPGVAVRLGGRHRARGLLRGAGRPVAAPPPRAHGVEAPARRLVLRQPPGGRGLRADRPRDARDRRVVGPRRPERPAGQLRPHLRPHHRLGGLRLRERAVRRRVPRVQPLAGGGTGGGLGRRPPGRRAPPGPRGVPRGARPLAGRRPPALLHLGRARLGLGRGAAQPDRRGDRLQRDHLARDGALRRRGLVAQRRGVRRLLRPVRPPFGVRDARPRPRRAPAALRAAAARRAAGHGRGGRGDDRDGHLRRALAGRPVARRLARDQRLLRRVGVLARADAAADLDRRPAARRRPRRGVLRSGDPGRALRRGQPRRGAPAPGVRALAHPDRHGLCRRPLPHLPHLPGTGDRLPRLRPDRPRVGPVRHRLLGDRLLRHQPERHVVRAGRLRGPRPRGGARARPRPRAGPLRAGAARGALAVLDARRDGRLHHPGPLAPRAGQRM